MKANVLLATQDKQFSRRLRAELGDLCHLELSASSGQVYDRITRKPFDLVMVDITLPSLDGVDLVRALRHAAKGNVLLMTLGRLDPLVYLTEPKTWESVVVPRSIRSASEIVRARLDPAAGRTIRDVRYHPQEDTFFVAFRDGRTYELPRKAIAGADRTAVMGHPEVIHGGDAFVFHQRSGKIYTVPWDLVLYHQEPSYPYFKGRSGQEKAAAERGRRIGERVRQSRERLGWSLDRLATRTGIRAPNLSRLESGKHVPALETLERVAQALGLRVVDLVAS